MTAVTVAARSKLPLWRTIGQSYAMWARNFPDLVRIAWVWMLLMGLVRVSWSWWVVPHILEALRAGGPAGQFIVVASQIVSQVIMLPALASVAVAWHRLLLRGEHPDRGLYLRFDRIVVGYAILAFWIAVIFKTPDYVIEMFRIVTGTALDRPTMPQLVGSVVGTLTGLIAARLSIALPGIALGREDVTLGSAWRVSKRNTWRMFWAYFFCAVPASVIVFVIFYFLGYWLLGYQAIVTFVLQFLSGVIWIPIGMISVGMLSLACRHFFEDDKVSSVFL
jgi:hypothetical protein